MKSSALENKDFYAGLLFVFFGLAALLLARGYPRGTASQMGAGYFPILLGGMLLVFGLILALKSLWGGNKTQPWGLRPLFLVLGSVVLFALLVEPLGLVPAMVPLIFISSMGGPEFRWKEVLILYLILTEMVVWGKVVKESGARAN
jgi:hypothetical protein